MADAQRQAPNQDSRVRLFLSHSERDKELVQPLRDWLQIGLDLEDIEIRCTSVENMAAGSVPAEVLRRDLLAAEAVVGLLTGNSLDSYWVQLEVGAAWVRDKLHPVCGPDLSSRDLPSPHCDITTADYCGVRSMRSLLRNLAVECHTTVCAEADEQLRAMTQAAREWRSAMALCWLQLPPAISAHSITEGDISGEIVNIKLRSLCEKLGLLVAEVQTWASPEGTLVHDPDDIPPWAAGYWTISKNAVNFLMGENNGKAQHCLYVPQNVLSPALEGRLIAALDSTDDNVARMRDWFSDSMDWITLHPPRPNVVHSGVGHRNH